MAQIKAVFEGLAAHGGTTESEKQARENLLQKLYGLIVASNGNGLDSSIGSSGMGTLWACAFCDTSPDAHQLALRCLTNIMVLSGPMRKVLLEQQYPSKLVELLKDYEAGDAWDAFVAARMLLRCAGDKDLDLVPYFESTRLPEVLNAGISHWAQNVGSLSPESLQAADEKLRLLSTILTRYPTQAHLFLKSLDAILALLDKTTISSPPLQSPLDSVINCLVTLPFVAEYHAGRLPWPPLDDAKLVQALDAALRAYKQEELETSLPPLLALLAAIAQDGPEDVITRLQARLLPSEEDRSERLGAGTSLPHRLVRLATGAVTPQLKSSLTVLLLALSNNDSEQLVRNVGYGCASGLLFSMGLPVPPADGAEGSNAGAGLDVNPITGQLRDKEQQADDLPEMTQEEKEREAERLFVLFERLRRTGVMNVENPVREAMESGRVQELGDDEDSD
ncbi:hypothetical protein GQ53DRAFT_743280 [Thozetella sp. PMI_491]|nr:hypothetical protein GQ53DRAFT_743280 [Thozetella sp. PMI_491]